MERSLTKLIAAVVAIAVLVAAGAGCGSSSKDRADDTVAPGTTATTVQPSGTTVSTASSTPPDGDGGIDPMDDAGTAPQSGPATGDGIGLLEAVRVARDEGFDRVVFQFRDHVPGYVVQYVDKPILSDGAGEVVPLEGNFAVSVRMEPASGVDLGGGGPNGFEEVYTGPKRIDAGTSEVTEVVQSGDFEAVLNWAIGTRDRVDFRVFTLTSPARLVVDLRNH